MTVKQANSHLILGMVNAAGCDQLQAIYDLFG
ncbi:hypothetical protein Dalk_0856 [Desulfatibacillum aliphaticivorans]|uniref:Uncharacterized protein n=1 Tax=Desulfatibacillum aliphaticivorans TaxID=218208 RepID=B8FHZ3_DESAL|nr:hypothetical protein Dalk_0855 [Desulfatibacillum aliphaticivorans]ACL02561.1 hypothetical protein Dalk_0856 [Desulfatibacillum aliphaticivorans]